MAISSRNLFHFTHRIAYLEDILRNGFWPRYCKEYGWGNKYIDFALPMVCFCDIPLSQISEHAKFYGGYGLGVAPTWVRKHKTITPVQYIALSSNEYHNISRLLTRLKNKKMTIEDSQKLCLVKKVSGNAIDKLGNVKPKKFYNEREWRYIPPEFSLIDGIIPINKKDGFDSDKLSEKTKSLRLTIGIKDISYIVIPNERHRSIIIDIIRDVFKKEDNNLVNTLLSRIISLDQIKDDF